MYCYSDCSIIPLVNEYDAYCIIKYSTKDQNGIKPLVVENIKTDLNVCTWQNGHP